MIRLSLESQLGSNSTGLRLRLSTIKLATQSWTWFDSTACAEEANADEFRLCNGHRTRGRL